MKSTAAASDGGAPCRVSVITPARNAEATLRAAAGSVLAQTYSSWELIVADDASTDGTSALAAELASLHPDRIRVVALTANSGPAAARNAAIAQARGELLALLDADDLWRPDYLEQQVGRYDEAIRQGRRVGIVACNATIVGFDGREQGTFADRFGWSDAITYAALVEYPYVFVSALFPRAAFDAVGGFSVDCWGSEDYDLWLRIVESGYEVVSNREPLAVSRLSPESLSRNQLRMADAALTAYRRALGRPAARGHARRVLRRRVRHYRALRERALLRDAVSSRRLASAAVSLARAVPIGLMAAAQEPGRWSEWLTSGRRTRRPAAGGQR